MPRPLIDSPFIFGVHEPGGERHMLAANRPGWVLFSEVLGHNPDDLSGVDYTGYSERGLGVIACLNHGYEPDGTIPHNSQYEQFARRVANFVGTSRGCKTWIIGNEMNYAIARPGIKVDWSRHTSQRSGVPEEADPMRRGLAVRFTALPDHSREIRTTRGAMISPGEVITPELYVRCYRLCRDAIHRLPGHEDDLVLVGAVAPWNTQTIYPGNPNGDWVQYFQDILTLLGPGNCDGLTLHACTHGADAALIANGARLGSPFQNRHLQFRVYMDFLMAVPPAMRALPAFLTEVGQDQPWLDRNTGWVQAMYAEIDGWNRQTGNQQIRAAILYRWPRIDRWYIDGKLGVEEDFKQALLHEYRWRGGEPAVSAAVPPPESIGEAPAPLVEAAPMPVATVVEPKPRGRRSRQQISEQPYQIEWISDHFPTRLTVGQVIVAPITLKNTGTKTWSWGGGNPFRLGYRYYRNRRLLAAPAGMELRTDVPEDVPPGQTIIIQARIALPTAPGNYTLELDLVQEGVTWFKDQGSPVLTRWLTVEAAEPDDEAGGTSVAVQLPVRLYTDISSQLPRSGTPYARRDLNQIRYIVISHTGAHAQLSLERIALAHIKRGYPGIAYDFVVDGSGHILKVTDLEDVAQPDQAWSEQGVNVCLTGNFNAAAPPLAQLDGAGRLCAWLAQNLGMAADAIVGLGDLIRTDSPGETFYKGPRWKEVLTRQVKLHLAVLGMAAGDSDRLREIDSVIDDLRSKNLELGRDLEQVHMIERQLRQANESLQAEVTELRQRVDAQPTVAEGGLRLRLMADKLPRDNGRYAARSADSIEFIVINHTGAPPETPLREIALAHRSEWPGILYDFVIDVKGEIFQTQPLDQVADTAEPYVRRAVNIAFAGDFSGDSMPTPDQMAAGGRLVAWLLVRYPHVGFDSVKGLSEFVATHSPGDGWQSGKAWKQLLLTSARRASGVVENTAAEDALRDRVSELEQRLRLVEQERLGLEEQRLELTEEQRRLEAEIASKPAVVASFVVPKPTLQVVVDQLPKHPVLRYDRRPLSQITHIAVHHTAAPSRLGPARIADLHIAADSGRGKEAWPGIGYHFFVHEDGSVEQTNYLETASYHVFRHHTYSVGVVFAGSFMNGKIPSSAQLRSGAHLIAWLMQDLNVPLARVWGHREFPDNMTVCPGGEWTQGNRWRDLLFERIREIQQGAGLKTTRHYMLFAQGSDGSPVGREEFVNALGYMTRFRPTVGFSIDEARNAEFVTIVGGEAGISAAEEQMLVQAGGRVERIAGRDASETDRLLAELVRVGRRFRSFEVDF